jgi:hypothetical protein
LSVGENDANNILDKWAQNISETENESQTEDDDDISDDED